MYGDYKKCLFSQAKTNLFYSSVSPSKLNAHSVRDKDGYEDITNDYISKSLFESCVRTGYLTKVAEPVTAIA